MFQFGGGRNCIIFTNIGIKLRQKLKYKDQIENEKMTPGIIVTRGTITATWQLFNFFNLKKNKNNKYSKIIKKNQKSRN